MRMSKAQLVNTSSSSYIKSSKSYLDLDHNDSFNEENLSVYENKSLAQTMMLETGEFSDYCQTPSFRSHCSSPREACLSVSSQISLAIPAKKSKKQVKTNPIYSYWIIPAAIGLLSLIFLSKR